MKFSPAQELILKRVTGKDVVTENDYYKLIEDMEWDIPQKYRSTMPIINSSEGTLRRIVSTQHTKKSKVKSDIPKGSKRELPLNYASTTPEAEYIICSAIWFNDDVVHDFSPKNINVGLVLCGRRHHNIFAQLKALGVDRKRFINADENKKIIQGFLTNTDRFVDRKEADEIAFKAGQTAEQHEMLMSEDLW